MKKVPVPVEPKNTYPMRINKYLALKGYSTRRGADELIEKGRVLINGRLAELGSKVIEADVIEVRNNRKPESYAYYVYNKPSGVITHSPQLGEKDIRNSLRISERSPKNSFSKSAGPENGKTKLPGPIEADIFPVGRLDKASNGLMILTNDGRITDRLLNPIHTHDKEYVVTTLNTLRSNFAKQMESGVEIGNNEGNKDKEESYVTKPCKVEIINNKTFRIILTEGKKHQIRRMCSALHNEVDELKRLRVANIKLGSLGINQYRKITGEELSEFLKSLGLKNN